jgi:hypothetical protein
MAAEHSTKSGCNASLDISPPLACGPGQRSQPLTAAKPGPRTARHARRGAAAGRSRSPYAGRRRGCTPEDPPASETFCRPTSHCTGPCLPGSLCLVLCLTALRASQTRLRLLPWRGTTPLPSPRTRRVGGEAWPSCVSVSPTRPAVARVPHPLPWQRPARPHACASVSRSCALSHRVLQSQPQRLQRCKSFCMSSAHRVCSHPLRAAPAA